MIRLANQLLPSSDLCDEKLLYFRGEAAINQGALLFCRAGDKIDFDTYFGSLPYSALKTHTTVRHIDYEFTASGEFEVEIKVANCDKIKKIDVTNEKQLDDSCFNVRELIIAKKQVKSTDKCSHKIEFDISNIDEEGIVFASFKALKAQSVLYNAAYYTNNSSINKTKIGIVICTFKREKYVIENVMRILNAINKEPIYDDKFQVIVVDNGNTLQKLQLTGATLIPNRNVGGSGGFTRGLVEVKSNTDCTHFLLMDDDIVFEPEILFRTFAYAHLAQNPSRLTIGGSMLTMDKPYFQYEKGATWNGRTIKANKYGYDLRLARNVIRNEFTEPIDYTAWWYCCMHVSTIDRIGLPMQMFIKCDDIEYSMRAKNDIMLVSGLGVWHESFNAKYSSELEYYIKRNELIVNAIYYKKYGAFFQIRKLTHSIAKQLIYHRYEVLDFIFDAYNDFLKGYEYFLSIDGEALHGKLRLNMIKQYSTQALIEKGYNINDKKIYKTSKTKFSYQKQMLTLNGYLIPKAFYPKNEKNSFRLIEMNNSKPKDMYKSNVTVQYNTATGVGFVTKLKKGKLISTGFKLFFMDVKLLLKYRSAAKTYRNGIKIMDNTKL